MDEGGTQLTATAWLKKPSLLPCHLLSVTGCPVVPLSQSLRMSRDVSYRPVTECAVRVLDPHRAALTQQYA